MSTLAPNSPADPAQLKDGAKCAGVKAIVAMDESLTASDWNEEASDMITEVLKTQKEVAELLQSHTTQTKELQAMKDSCTEEVCCFQALQPQVSQHCAHVLLPATRP